jgi:hypothetical protein
VSPTACLQRRATPTAGDRMSNERVGRARRDAPNPGDEPVVLARDTEAPVGSSARNANGEDCAALVRHQTLRFACPVCGRRALDVTRKRHRDGAGHAVLLYCHHCHAPKALIAATLGLREHRLYRWPPPGELGQPVSRGRAVRRGPVVSEGTVAGCVSALWTEKYAHALVYLRETRGLTDDTIRKHELGYDIAENAIVFPIREQSIVAIKRRFLDPAANPKTANSPGPVRLYPDVPASGGLLFVPGEIDALTARQLGLPGLTSTGGWLAKHQVPLLAGRRVFLLPDVGEELAAEHQSAWLRDVDCEVHVVHWPPGLPERTDLNDWFTTRGGTRAELLALVRQARSAA